MADAIAPLHQTGNTASVLRRTKTWASCSTTEAERFQARRRGFYNRLLATGPLGGVFAKICKIAERFEKFPVSRCERVHSAQRRHAANFVKACKRAESVRRFSRYFTADARSIR